MKKSLFLLLAVTASFILPSEAQAELRERFASALQGTEFQPAELAVIEEPEFASVLAELAAEQGIVPSGTALRYEANPDVLVMPLGTERPEADDALTLLFDRKTKTSYFLLLSPGSGAMDVGSVRLWSQGATEIVIDAQGIYYSPVPGVQTFRLSGLGNRPEKAIADNLLCLARLLGFTINPTRLDTALSSVVCSAFQANDIARNLAEIVLIGGHCFSAVNCLGFCPASSALCLTGLAKWISCGIAECGGTATVPSAPALSSPADGATISGTAVTLSWSNVAGATKYQTQVSLNSSFSNPVTGNESSSTSARWTGFSNNGSRWHWRARAGNAQGWSQWSSSRSFINGTTAVAPVAPALLSPANGARVSGSAVTLTYSSVSGATRYQTQLSLDPSFSNPITGNEFAATSVRWTGFSSNGSRWHWRARAGNAQGWSAWSSSRSFINGS